MFKFACSLIILLALSPLTAMMSDGDEVLPERSALPGEVVKPYDWSVDTPSHGVVEGVIFWKYAQGYIDTQTRIAMIHKQHYLNLEKEYETLKASPPAGVNIQLKYYEMLKAKYQYIQESYKCIPGSKHEIRKKGVAEAASKLEEVESYIRGLSGNR